MASNQHFSSLYLIMISCDLISYTFLLRKVSNSPSSFDAMAYDGAVLGKKGNSLFCAYMLLLISWLLTFILPS